MSENKHTEEKTLEISERDVLAALCEAYLTFHARAKVAENPKHWHEQMTATMRVMHDIRRVSNIKDETRRKWVLSDALAKSAKLIKDARTTPEQRLLNAIFTEKAESC